MSPLILLIIVLALVAVFVVGVYNGLIKLRNRADEAWSDIDVQLKRRYNLIPNLVESVKGYATHEEGVFTKVTEARSNAINATNLQEQGAAENMLSGALKSLFAVAENYPDLRANENFIQLQNELVDTEDKIQSARRFYNGTVRDLNTKIQQFPNNIIAGMFKFEDKEFFEIEKDEEKENVKVSFDNTEAAAPVAPVAPTPTPEAAPAEPVVETPAPVAEEPTPEPVVEEAPAKCEKCGGEMTEGHTCPVQAPEEAAPAEPVAETPVEASPEPVAEEPTPEPVAEEAPTPEAPAKCEKCGGEMTEGHTCPVQAPEETTPEASPETPAPSADAPAESTDETPAV